MADGLQLENGDDLERWLEGRPGETRASEAHVIALRAALRVAPFYWNRVAQSDRELHVTALPVQRALLISGVSAARASDGIRNAAAQAAIAVDAAAIEIDSNRSTAAASTAHRAGDAGFAARDASRSAMIEDVTIREVGSVIGSATIGSAKITEIEVAKDETIEVAVSAVASAASANSAVWIAVQSDCRALENGDPVLEGALWPGALPDWLGDVGFLADWRDCGPAGVFWADWFESYSQGRSQDMAFLEKIALGAPWDDGEDAVDAFIEELLLERGVEKTPNAERIVENPETHRLRAEPLSDLPADHLADAVDKMRDANATFDGTGGGNDPYGELRPERDILDRAVTAYSARPRRLYDTCRRVSRRVTGKVARGDCPEHDPLIEDYVRQLDEAASDLRNFDPKVAEMVVARVQADMDAAAPEKRGLLKEAADEIAPALEGELAEEIPEDIETATDPAEPEATRKEATYRTISRLIRIYSIGRKGLSEAAGVSKDIAMVLGAVGGGSFALWKAVQYLLTLM